MANQTTSMGHQVMLHQVATIPSLQTVPTTVFRRTRSKLTNSCFQRKEKGHLGNKKLLKARMTLHKKACHSQEREQDNQDLVSPVVNNSIEHVVKSSRNTCAVNANPEHAKYTAFITHIGKFEDTRMPQHSNEKSSFKANLKCYFHCCEGLVNSPSTLARLMVEIFGKIKSLLQYFADLLVHSKLYYKVHFIEIIRMLLYCRKCLLFISKEKSEMLKTEVDFLGFHIHKYGFFRRYIENYAEKTYHISKESKGKNKKTLSDESLKEFNNLKKEFEGENIVAIPIEQDKTILIDIEKVKASTDMPIHSDNNNINNGSFHFNTKKIIRDNILDAQTNAQKYYNRVGYQKKQCVQ
ncbi:hypothetical protein ACTFIR_011857 [Dictyostelium discoideum]